MQAAKVHHNDWLSVIAAYSPVKAAEHASSVAMSKNSTQSPFGLYRRFLPKNHAYWVIRIPGVRTSWTGYFLSRRRHETSDTKMRAYCSSSVAAKIPARWDLYMCMCMDMSSLVDRNHKEQINLQNQ